MCIICFVRFHSTPLAIYHLHVVCLLYDHDQGKINSVLCEYHQQVTDTFSVCFETIAKWRTVLSTLSFFLA